MLLRRPRSGQDAGPSPFRRLDVAGLRRQYAQLEALPKAEATAGSPLLAEPGKVPLPRFHLAAPASGPTVAEAVDGLNAQGYWPARLGSTSHPFTRQASRQIAPGDSQTHVGDETDTSPFPSASPVAGISTGAYIRHMSVLIRVLGHAASR